MQGVDFIADGVDLKGAGLGCKHQGGKRFLKMDHKLRDAHTEGDLGLALEGLGKVAGDFGVTEGNVGPVEAKPIRLLTDTYSTLASTLLSLSAIASRFMHFPRVVISLFMRLASSNRLPFD